MKKQLRVRDVKQPLKPGTVLKDIISGEEYKIRNLISVEDGIFVYMVKPGIELSYIPSPDDIIVSQP